MTNGLNGARGVSIFALQNTVDGGPIAASAANSTTINFDSVSNGSAVIAVLNDNGDGSVSANSPLTQTLAFTAGGGGSRGAAGYNVADAGAQNFSFTSSGGRSSLSIVSFEAVPEPGTLALAGLGGLLLVAMRRRKR